MSLVKIRPIKESEIFKLEDMLYEAIFQPEGYAPIPRTVLDVPEVNAYIQDLRSKGYKQASLDVQKANYAAKMYKKLGFEVIKETKDTYLMLLRLN